MVLLWTWLAIKFCPASCTLQLGMRIAKRVRARHALETR